MKRVIVRFASLMVAGLLALSPAARAQQAPGAERCTADTAPEAALRLGIARDAGIDGVQDPGKAAECYRRAATAGNTQAQLGLAALYRSGRGVPRDPDQARHWYEKAAEQGDGRAAYALGTMFETGNGVPKHLPTALHWYHVALDRGMADAVSKITTLEDESGARRDPAVVAQKPEAPPPPAEPSGDPVPGTEFKDAAGRPCRLLQTMVNLDGRTETARATVCRDASGRWVLVPSGTQ